MSALPNFLPQRPLRGSSDSRPWFKRGEVRGMASVGVSRPSRHRIGTAIVGRKVPLAKGSLIEAISHFVLNAVMSDFCLLQSCLRQSRGDNNLFVGLGQTPVHSGSRASDRGFPPSRERRRWTAMSSRRSIGGAFIHRRHPQLLVQGVASSAGKGGTPMAAGGVRLWPAGSRKGRGVARLSAMPSMARRASVTSGMSPLVEMRRASRAM